MRRKEEGGLGLLDPRCYFDAAKIRILKIMKLKKGQPWIKWMERKEIRLKEKWNVQGNLFGFKQSREQKREVESKCIFGNILAIWREAGGTTKRHS